MARTRELHAGERAHRRHRRHALVKLLLLPVVAAGVARRVFATADDSSPAVARESDASPQQDWVNLHTEERLLALDPERISARDVREVLARGPSPRIIAMQGSVPFVTMKPFADFLVAMDYPEERLRNPRDLSYSYSSYADSRALAGSLAWYYEREGMVPMLIGHSQGGMLAIKVLHELAGAFADRVPVWNPLADAPEDRYAVRDPLTGETRPVVGLRVPYAAALATGKLMRLLLGQWSMLSRVREIPDTVAEFTGFYIEWDPIAGTGPGAATRDPYRPTGSASVRTVTLPVGYSHVSLPVTEHLATDPVTRAWIEAYRPGIAPPPPAAGADVRNLLHAADIWWSIKKHWCLEAQRLARARRARVAGGGS